jgi:hypothetical protein
MAVDFVIIAQRIGQWLMVPNCGDALKDFG